MGLFDQHEPLREERVEEQTAKVAALEDDKGVVTTTYNSISNSLYDLADSNSKTTTVLLPNGTTIRLAATSRPGLGSYRATFEVAAKGGEPQTVYGNTSATDLAFKLDVLALSAKQKAALQRLGESELLEMAREHLLEAKVNVSGYVTKRGRHVGAYSQIRKALAKIGDGGAAHFPDGITVKRGGGGFEVYGGGGEGGPSSAAADSVDKAASQVAIRSMSSEHPKSLGGKQRHQSAAFGSAITGDTKKRVDQLPADNPKLPGTPHPEAVADKAAKALKAAKLPSRKERAENERKAGERKTAENMKKNGGDELDNFDTGQPKVPSTKRSREGAKRLAADNEAMAKRDARERRDKARRRANDESPMPGVIRKPSESDAIRAAGSRKSVHGKEWKGRLSARMDSMKDGDKLDLPEGTKVEKRDGKLLVNGTPSGTTASAADQAEASERERQRRMSADHKRNFPDGAPGWSGPGKYKRDPRDSSAAANIDREKRRRKAQEAESPGLIGR